MKWPSGRKKGTLLMTAKTPQDSDVRGRVVDPGTSFVVSAPAGSGKTGLLTHRVLCLLSVVNHPEDILAITFTRKAAAEMQERIFGWLHKASLSKASETAKQSNYDSVLLDAAQKALSQNEALGWDLLSNPSRLKISTIDGFCKGVCNQLPFFSSIGSSTAILEEAENEYTLTPRS